MDPYRHLFISLNPDGSLSRHLPIPTVPATLDNGSAVDVLSKDLPLNPSHSTSLRIFLPQRPPSKLLLPIILYFHGGGFIVFSAATSVIHSSCSRRAASIPAIVVSVEYRLAPEHRLPAAYDDAVDALLWLRDQSQSSLTADPWLKDHADFSQCFIMGTSAGANIAYHLGLRAVGLDPLEPLRFVGLIMNQPFFGGEGRTDSEARSAEDKILPLAASDLMWELALPKGANREHEYCNPMATIAKSEGLPRCLVKGFVGDPLYDRQKEFVKGLKEAGVDVVVEMEEKGYHGIEMLDSSKEEGLVQDCTRFVYGIDHNNNTNAKIKK